MSKYIDMEVQKGNRKANTHGALRIGYYLDMRKGTWGKLRKVSDRSLN